ncbi:MAG: hypothetical protein A3D31_02095 [Candidatus Fluviicola riflensis]|nr:MAG: hypothetical protein CHH17_12940 [Candidatus Fluviicola riflensis]OGS78788.1 MAG: hypothetical protein A3D31_02095 [Candidatus Fluviicola riflensis]OGS86219.1 MAG: hypothetical protein A2724_01550 [Fluviicola sp. RIFCSPHIGHO2_01_FULL_43_53]OGS87661.1 MAG: hypothetical protein A3E30_16355 [Fluviicola sp. RIFCSPHIGHO2_12_FULL_43_24]
MHHYLISYDLIDSERFNGTYRDQMIRFLLENNCSELTSNVATTIYFTTYHSLFELQSSIIKSRLKDDIYYHLVQIATKPLSETPKMEVHPNPDIVKGFDADVARIDESMD